MELRRSKRSLAGRHSCKALLLVLVLATALPMSDASLCSIYKLRSSCEKMYTDAGGCLWDANAKLCVADTNKPLPVGTVAIALVELDPDSVPLELKPGPSSSFGSISLREGLPVGPSANITVAESPEAETEIDGARTGKQLRAVATDTVISKDSTSSEEQGPENGMFCAMLPEVGTCRAAIPRWHWDVPSNSCKPFIYGGCDGNENNFSTEEACSVSAQQWCGETASAPAEEGIVAYSAAGYARSCPALLLSLAVMVLLLCLGGQLA